MAYFALVLLLACSVLYAVAAGRVRLLLAARVAAFGASLLLAGVLVLRSVEIGYPALTGTYEGLLVCVFVIAAAAAAGQRRIFRDNGGLLAASTFVAFVLLAILSSPLVSQEVHPPLPILRSGWLVLHVAFAFVGLSLFTVAFIASIAGLAAGRRKPHPKTDSVQDKAIVGGFVFYATGGLVFGAIWAEAAWGRFWGWDPKETWALVTTLAYAVYLHLRYARRISPVVLRVVSIVSWFAGIFTFFGVNYLLSGLHSYG